MPGDTKKNEIIVKARFNGKIVHPTFPAILSGLICIKNQKMVAKIFWKVSFKKGFSAKLLSAEPSLHWTVILGCRARKKDVIFFAKKGGNDEILELMGLSQACGVPQAHQPKRIMCPLKKWRQYILSMGKVKVNISLFSALFSIGKTFCHLKGTCTYRLNFFSHYQSMKSSSLHCVCWYKGFKSLKTKCSTRQKGDGIGAF